MHDGTGGGVAQGGGQSERACHLRGFLTNWAKGDQVVWILTATKVSGGSRYLQHRTYPRDAGSVVLESS